MSGAGIGSTLGTLAGAALAPETGGLSLAIPAALGAGGAALGGAFTGSKNPLQDALLGGIAGGLGGGFGLGDELGISNSAGLFDPATAAGAEGVGAANLGNAGTASILDSAPAPALGSTGADALSNSTPSLAAEGYGGTPLSMAPLPDPSGVGTIGAGTATPPSSGIMGYLGKQNPLNLALAGGSALSGIQSLLPHKKVDVGQNAANVMGTNPNFNASLPQYSLQNTATPYAGDWYKYGQTPEPVMYNAQPQRLAHGGMVKGYAAGGDVQANPLMNASPQATANPLVLKAAHDVGVQIGKHLKKQSPLFTGHGQVGGQGGGQDDAVHAKLSQGEFVLPADIPSALGDGSTEEGAKKLEKMVYKIRAHKTSKGSKFPPKAKNPLSYIKGA